MQAAGISKRSYSVCLNMSQWSFSLAVRFGTTSLICAGNSSQVVYVAVYTPVIIFGTSKEHT
jgi:hypothetical protein